MSARYTKEWTVTVRRKDVYFDVDLLSLYYAETAGGENPVRDNRVATETASAGNRRIVKRKCDHRASDIRRVLARFLAPGEASSADDALEDADWTFRLAVSTEAEDATLATLADLAHEYIVTGGLLDFFTAIGVNGNRESLQERADAALEDIRRIIHHRPMP